jgi:hypothetical protein
VLLGFALVLLAALFRSPRSGWAAINGAQVGMARAQSSNTTSAPDKSGDTLFAAAPALGSVATK